MICPDISYLWNAEDISSENSNVPRECSPEGSSPEEEQENKRMRRMQRNRESASLSRERRKIQMADKDKQMADLQAMYSSISGSLSHPQIVFCLNIRRRVRFTAP